MSNHLWPFNSNLLGRALLTDIETVEDELDEEGKKLFANSGEFPKIIVFSAGKAEVKTLKSPSDTDAFCAVPTKQKSTQIVFLSQFASWKHFNIPLHSLRRLFTHLSIQSSFWSVFRKLIQVEGKERESSGGFRSSSISPDGSSSITYNARSSALPNDGREGFLWTFRQTVVHHQYNAIQESHTFIVCSLSKLLCTYLSELSTAEDFEPAAIHQVILQSVTEPWEEYISYEENRFKNNEIKSRLSKDMSCRTTPQIGFRVDQADAQKILVLQDTLHLAQHLIDTNLSIFPEVIKLLPYFQKSNGGSQGSLNTAPDVIARIGLESLAAQTATSKSRAESLLRRLEAVAALVSLILANELAALGREDAKKTTADAKKLTKITTLGIVYLPASFVATLLGTQYIKVGNKKNGNVTIVVRGEMVIFAVLTVILLFLTIGSWIIWERWGSIKKRFEEHWNKVGRVKDKRTVSKV